MPPKSKTATKGGKAGKKEKVFHPGSRKAAQLARHAIRKGKLGSIRTKANKKTSSRLDFYAFIHARISPDTTALTLPELHAILQAWVGRNDTALAAEQAARRQGRPKSPREMRIEELRLREQETYRTGMELPDLRDAVTLERFRKWDVTSLGYAHLLRFVRICSARPDDAVLSRAPIDEGGADSEADDDDSEAPQLMDHMDET
ncbi:hypothetical protein GGX14DRAFT_649715 [Mycena pura]|uniref:Translation machinery-associated protein 16 n=1 Tax=Mycena pura TaxID=153505 RepID=A0AAD7E2X1_9AGAR|nr:hypothetical protein GGX14DRAFT_649715 [Mycena pura]